MQKKLAISILSLIISASLALFFMLLFFRPMTVGTPFYQGYEKVWSHRSLSDGLPENSPQGLNRSFELGAPGVEIDIIYDVSSSCFYVISEEAFAAGNSLSLKLADMLNLIPPRKFIWLDFWNLKILPIEDARRATSRLRMELETAFLIERAIIESTDPVRLGLVASAGMRTILWINVRPGSDGRLSYLRDLIVSVIGFRSANFSAISLEYTQYDNLIGIVFSRVPIHLFTVNDPPTLLGLINDPRVKVILSDHLYFRGSDCR